MGDMKYYLAPGANQLVAGRYQFTITERLGNVTFGVYATQDKDEQAELDRLASSGAIEAIDEAMFQKKSKAPSPNILTGQGEKIFTPSPGHQPAQVIQTAPTAVLAEEPEVVGVEPVADIDAVLTQAMPKTNVRPIDDGVGRPSDGQVAVPIKAKAKAKK